MKGIKEIFKTYLSFLVVLVLVSVEAWVAHLQDIAGGRKCWSSENADNCTLKTIPYFRNFREDGYKLWVQCFRASFGWTSVRYDWLIVYMATINQSSVFSIPNDLRYRCAKSSFPFPSQFLEWGIDYLVILFNGSTPRMHPHASFRVVHQFFFLS